jgi:hypothetical protein
MTRSRELSRYIIPSELPSPTTAGNLLFTEDGSVWSSIAKIDGTTAAVAVSGAADMGFAAFPSWVKRITFQFTGLSTTGTSGAVLQLGTGSEFSPTWKTSGYIGAWSAAYNGTASGAGTFSTGIIINNNNAATAIMSGMVTITKFEGNTWVANMSHGRTGDNNAGMTAGGYVTLDSAVVAVRIICGGTNTFDAGKVSALYE